MLYQYVIWHYTTCIKVIELSHLFDTLTCNKSNISSHIPQNTNAFDGSAAPILNGYFKLIQLVYYDTVLLWQCVSIHSPLLPLASLRPQVAVRHSTWNVVCFSAALRNKKSIQIGSTTVRLSSLRKHAAARYRVAKTHRIPYLYRSFSAKEPYI